MSDSVLAGLLRAIDLAVIERLSNHTFTFVAPPPAWLSGAFAAAPDGERQTLGGAFPFLDDFLHQANGAWDAGPHASIVSGPFSATLAGDELLLRASALTVEGRALLVIERLVGAADTRPILQKARQHMLDSEQLTRHASKVHAPAAAIAEAVGELNRTTLSREQQTLVDCLATASDLLNAAAAALPMPPPNRRKAT